MQVCGVYTFQSFSSSTVMKRVIEHIKKAPLRTSGIFVAVVFCFLFSQANQLPSSSEEMSIRATEQSVSYETTQMTARAGGVVIDNLIG